MTSEVEDQLRLHAAYESERRLRVADVRRPPADGAARLLGTRHGVHVCAALEQLLTQVRADEAGGAGHERLLAAE